MLTRMFIKLFSSQCDDFSSHWLENNFINVPVNWHEKKFAEYKISLEIVL